MAQILLVVCALSCCSSSSSAAAPGRASQADSSRRFPLRERASSEQALAWDLTYQNGILGERVEVWWEDDRRWYGGVVRAFDLISGSHTVVYDDGAQRIPDRPRLEPEPAAPCD